MAGKKDWYLVCYDIRDPDRWRKSYKLLQGYGQRIQYSIFRCRLTNREREKMRWELSQELTPEDNLLIIGICSGCAGRIPSINRPDEWSTGEEQTFTIV